ncbi:MAG TPA: hypothetical protein VFB04_06055 [Terriglobales bacterium]|nr:hypothetical protein [Terriglobales bacterium]
MERKRFLTFNALGAAVWVTSIALTGYVFGNEFNSLLDYFEKASWAIAGGLFTLAYLIWRREKKEVQGATSPARAQSSLAREIAKPRAEYRRAPRQREPCAITSS